MSTWSRFTLEFETPVTEEQWEIVTALLLDEGAEGTFCEAFDEQVFTEAPRDSSDSETADKTAQSGHVYYQLDARADFDYLKIAAAKGSSDQDFERIKKEIIESICDTLEELSGLPAFEVTYIDVDEDGWIEMAKPYYHASQVSELFIVGPPEERHTFPRESDEQHYIAIEFGPAFGTGTHPTTQLCLKILEELDEPPKSVLDLGTGTGVLSIASCLLGAQYAVGMDCLDKAQDQFLQNIRSNELEDQCDYIHGKTLQEAQMGCLLSGVSLPELILCNMLSAEFDEFLEPLSQWRKPMILSGFLEAEIQTVESRLNDTGWQITRRVTNRDWAAFYCVPS